MLIHAFLAFAALFGSPSLPDVPILSGWREIAVIGGVAVDLGPSIRVGDIRGGTANRVPYDDGTEMAWLGAPSTSGQYLGWNGSALGWYTPSGGGGGGTVTSVGLSLPSQFTLSPTTITTSGVFSVGWQTESANQVFLSGSGTPAFGSLTNSYLPSEAGDVSGNPGSTVVGGIQGIAVAASPTPGTILEYDGSGLNWYLRSALTPCRVATTANLSATYSNGTSGVGATLTSTVVVGLTIDGVSLNTGDYVLVKNQSTAYQNGIYKVTNPGSGVDWVLTRRFDFNQAANVLCGDQVPIQEGTVNASTVWQLTTATETAVTVGTTSLTFGQVGGTGAMTAGTGISFSGNDNDTIGLTTAGPGAGALGLGANVTVDAYGRVSSAALPTGTASSSTYLRGDGSWSTPSGSTSPGGSSTDVQYNSSGSFAGSANLTFDGNGVSQTMGSVSEAGLTINGIASQTADYFDVISSGSTTELALASSGLLKITSTTSGGSALLTANATSGAQIAASYLSSSISNGTKLGAYQFNGGSAATETAAQIVAYGAGTWSGSTSWPSYLSFFTTPSGSATTNERLRLDSAGSVVLNPSGSAVSTSATGGFTYVPSMTGPPTGTPTSYTGAVPLAYDSSDNVLYGYSGSNWVDAGGGYVHAISASATMNVYDKVINGTPIVSTTLTLCSNSAYKGREILVIYGHGATHAITVAAGSGDTIENAGTAGSISVGASGTFAHYARLVSTGDGYWWVVGGN